MIFQVFTLELIVNSLFSHYPNIETKSKIWYTRRIIIATFFLKIFLAKYADEWKSGRDKEQWCITIHFNICKVCEPSHEMQY